MIRRPGLTLVELLVSIFAMGLIFLIVTNIYIGTGRFTSAEQTQIDVGTSASRTLSTFDRTLREASDVLTSVVYSGTTYTSGDTTLVITTPSTLSDGTLSLFAADTEVLYLDTSVANNYQIKLITAALGTGSTRTTGVTTITDGVQDLFFRYNTDDITAASQVTATVRFTKTNGGRTYSNISILNATLRNHE